MPKNLRVEDQSSEIPAKRRKVTWHDENDKAKGIARLLLIKKNGPVSQIIHQHYSEYWLKRGAMKATDIVAHLALEFDKYCDYVDRCASGRKLKLKGEFFKNACKNARRVLNCFRKKCNRVRLMKNLLDRPDVAAFPWNVIMDEELKSLPEYTKWQSSVFESNIENMVVDDIFYLKSKQNVLGWWSQFDAQRSDPDSVMKVLIAFYPLFQDVTPLWQMANVTHTREFVEELYLELFTDHKDDDLKPIEQWIISLGYSQTIIDEMKEVLSLW